MKGICNNMKKINPIVYAAVAAFVIIVTGIILTIKEVNKGPEIQSTPNLIEIESESVNKSEIKETDLQITETTTELPTIIETEPATEIGTEKTTQKETVSEIIMPTKPAVEITENSTEALTIPEVPTEGLTEIPSETQTETQTEPATESVTYSEYIFTPYSKDVIICKTYAEAQNMNVRKLELAESLYRANTNYDIYKEKIIELVEGINNERSSRNLPDLKLNESLSKNAGVISTENAYCGFLITAIDENGRKISLTPELSSVYDLMINNGKNGYFSEKYLRFTSDISSALEKLTSSSVVMSDKYEEIGIGIDKSEDNVYYITVFLFTEV